MTLLINHDVNDEVYLDKLYVRMVKIRHIEETTTPMYVMTSSARGETVSPGLRSWIFMIEQTVLN